MHPLIGNAKPEAESLARMQERWSDGTRWAAYQNVAMDSRDLGHLKFLHVGKDCTLAEAPEKLPDFANTINWCYQLVGYVNLETGEVEGETT